MDEISWQIIDLVMSAQAVLGEQFGVSLLLILTLALHYVGTLDLVQTTTIMETLKGVATSTPTLLQ